jgi:hypothetical protein
MRDGYDEALAYAEAVDGLLPPPLEEPVDPDEQLWHTASFPAVTDEPERRRKLTTGLAVLGASTLGLCGFAGVKLAAMAGVTPPSAPRYVISDQVQAALGRAQQQDALRPPAVGPQPALPAAVGPPTPVRPRSASIGQFRGRDGDGRGRGDGRRGDDGDRAKPKHKRKKSD